MKAFLGLLFAVVFFFVADYLKTYHDYSDVAYSGALAFAGIGGCVIAFSGRITKLKFAGSEVELARREIGEAKSKAIAEIRQEVNRLKREATDHAGRIGHLENTETELIIDEEGDARPVMVRTDEYGGKLARYTDSDGRCREVTWNG